MQNNFRNLFIYLSFVVCLFGENPSFDFSYELKYGDGTGVKNEGNTIYDLKFNENFIKINSSYKDYYLYLELEYSDPPILGFSNKEIQDILTRFYIEKQFEKTHVKAGDIYTLYGVGLGLYTFPDQNIDFDNSIRGIELKYYISDNIDLFIIGGKSNFNQRTNPAILEPNRFSDNTLKVVGLNYNSSIGYGHILFKNQESYMDNSTLQTFVLGEGDRSTVFDWDFTERLEQMIIDSGLSVSDYWLSFDGYTLDTESFNLGYGVYSDFIDAYFEGEWANYDKLLGGQVSGHRYYLSLSKNIKNIGISYDYKDYDMPYDLITFSSPPTVLIESTSILAGRNSHSMNYGDEVGHQIEVVGPIFKDLNFLTNMSIARRHDAKSSLYVSGAGLSEYVQSYNGVTSGDEVNYIQQLIDDSNSFINDQNNMVVIESPVSALTFSDYISFNQQSQDFISFYPYRQIYGEINGYLNDNLYVKIGYDIYNEVIKHKTKKVFSYDMSELSLGINAINSAVQAVVDERWGSFESQCQQIIDYGFECSAQDTDGSGTVDPDEYADQQFLNQFGVSKEEYLSSLGIENQLSLNQDTGYNHEIAEAWTIPFQLTYDLSGGNSTNFYLEYQSKKISQSSAYTDIDNFYFSGSYTHKGYLTATLFYEQENKSFSSGSSSVDDNWPGLDLSFDLGDKGLLSVFYGSQKGGRVCANGICADQPGFEDGVKVTYRTFF